MSIFEEKGIKPMLIVEQEKPFDSDDYIFEIKLDGIRCIAYLDETGVDLRNKRDKKLLQYVPELSAINCQVKEKCILDGELFILKEGVTDFYEIQKRVMMSDSFKITLAAKRYPASFVAFDILYCKDKQLDKLPLISRKKILSEILMENERISVSRYIESKGIELFDLTKKNGLEGIVAKKKDSLYLFNSKTKNWIKCKVMSTDDCVICGYIRKEHNMTSLILGQYDQKKLVYRGHVTLGVSGEIIKKLDQFIIDTSPFELIPKGNNDAVWLFPYNVCIVESMPTEKEGFRQPVFRGIRDDKAPEDCVI